jgi:hypothetical protein
MGVGILRRKTSPTGPNLQMRVSELGHYPRPCCYSAQMSDVVDLLEAFETAQKKEGVIVL